MKTKTEFGGGHLSYCTNIHPGESWEEVRSNLQVHLPRVREALLARNEIAGDLVADSGFGVGLRLSGQACYDLQKPGCLEEFQAFLEGENLYVYTLNGFPYGAFHGTRVKEDVYLPDWRDSERVHYSKQLAEVMASLLPAGLSGSVSTVPVAFKSTVKSAQEVGEMAAALLDVAAHLVQIERRTGKMITLALEPEPCCYLETVAETIAFFNQQIFASRAVASFATRIGVANEEAEILLRRHLSVCLDLCHAAVEFEDPFESVDALISAGISVGKLQISSGLRMVDVTPERAKHLAVFDDSTYLHQVIERNGQQISRYPDLEDAFSSLANGQSRDEWRVHCHVPLFLNDFGDFSSTQFYVAETLKRHREQAISSHLEVETYTWSVLPDAYRGEDMDSAIARELDWVLQQWLST